MRLRLVYKEQEAILIARLCNQESGFLFTVLMLENKGEFRRTDMAVIIT